MSERYEVAVGDARLHVRLDGPEDAPAVVLVNSLATSLEMWEPQIPALARRYRVLRYDARGHGRSSAPPGPYSMDMLADDLLGLVAHFRIERACVAGVSLGGLTALAVGLRRPPPVVAVAVCDARVDMPPEFAKGIDDRNRLVREKGMGAIADTMVERWFTPPTLRAAPPVLDEIRAMIRATSVEGFAASAAAIKDSGLRPRVRELRLPALFVVGDQDAALPVALMRQLHEEVPGSDFVEIAGAGHLSNIEQPAAFNEALLGFLARVF